MTSLHDAPGIREFTGGVTFRAFRQVAVRRSWTVDAVLSLLARRGAETFGGPRSSAYYESPRHYVTRVLDRWRVHETDDLVIPYRSLIGLYVETRVHEGPRATGDAVCGCGCGLAVTGRHRYASPACRKRVSRQRQVSNVRDPLDRPEKPHARQGVFRDIRAGQVDPVLLSHFARANRL